MMTIGMVLQLQIFSLLRSPSLFVQVSIARLKFETALKPLSRSFENTAPTSVCVRLDEFSPTLLNSLKCHLCRISREFFEFSLLQTSRALFAQSKHLAKAALDFQAKEKGEL